MNQYVVISGSTREKSESFKVSGFVAKALQQADPGSNVEIVNLATAGIPNWSEDFWGDEPPSPEWTEVSNKLKQSLGVVFVAPEWNGMAPPELMNIFLLASKDEISHKPALIVTVSSGTGGAYPVAELRNYGYKNTRVVYIPDHVIIRDVNNVFNDEEPQSSADKYLRDRLLYSANMLKVYAQAFVQIRESGAYDRKSFPYGM